MTLFKNKYRAETTRLKSWDYSGDGYYFITVFIKDRVCLLGEITDDFMQMNEFGKIVNDCWFDLPNHYTNMLLDAFCIMPNHIHGIIVIDNGMVLPTIHGSNDTGLPSIHRSNDTGLKPVSTIMPNDSVPKRHGLFEFVRALKSFSARRINELRNTTGEHVWQERFHDHIIRNDTALQRIREYILNNSKTWNHDKHFA
jgi:putative transposase